MPRNLDQVMEQYRNVGNMNIPTPQPPPYVVPNAFQAPSYGPPPPRMAPLGGDPYGAMVSRYGGYDDIVAARARQSAGTAGSFIGAGIGFGMGMVGGPKGAFLGAGTGEFLGNMLGTGLGYVPGISHAFRGYQRMMHGDAISQMAATNTLQQGMYGRVSLGGGAIGAGGAGINPMAAHQLMGQLRPSSQGAGGFDRQAMANLASAAAETGFLDTSANIQQIAGVVKKLGSVMGEMARLTGDPDFRRNLRELSNMRNMGLTVDESLRTLRDVRMFGRMAGGVERAQAGAAAGAQAFQQQGLTGGLGMGIGAGVAGMAGVGMGQFSPIERGLFGGQEGVQNIMLQGQAQFLGQTAKMFLPYVLERGRDGKLTINQQKLNQIRSGKMGMTDIVSQGQANLAGMGPGAMQEMLTNLPALQTQMGQQAGGAVGVFAMQAGMVRQLMKQIPGLSMQGAAQVLTGDQQAGAVLSRQMQDPDMIRRMQAQVREEMHRVRAEAREQRMAQRDLEGGVIQRAWEEKIDVNAGAGGWVGGFGRRRRGEAAREAWDQARAQAEEQDRMMGITRYRELPGMQTDEEEQAIATERRSRMTTQQLRENAMDLEQRRSVGLRLFSPLQVQGAVDAQGRALERVGWTGSQVASQWLGAGGGATGRRELTAGQIEAANMMEGRRSWYQIGLGTVYGLKKFGAGFTEDESGLMQTRQRVETAAKAAEEAGRAIYGMQRLTSEDFSRGEDNLRKALVEGQRLDPGNVHRAMIDARGAVLRYAHQQGVKDAGLDPAKVREHMIKALTTSGNMNRAEAEAFVGKNKDKLLMQAYNWVDRSGDVRGQQAIRNTADAAGVTKLRTFEDLYASREALGKQLRESYADVGLLSRGVFGVTQPTEEEERGIRALYKEKDSDVRALAMIAGGFEEFQGQMGEEEAARFRELEERLTKTPEGRAKLEKAKQLGKMLTREQRQQMATQFAARGEKFETFAADVERGISGGGGRFAGMSIRTEVAAHAARAKQEGWDVSELIGAGAGQTTPEGQKKLGELGELGDTLDDMATRMNIASENLLMFANMMKDKILVGGLPTNRGT